MESVVRTVYGSALQTAMLLGIPYDVKENTTINERFDIEKDAILPDNVYPRVAYFCIGNGGHSLTSGTDGVPYIKSRQHEATNANLFKPLPFIVRAVDNDLSPTMRARYAMRKRETYNGQAYYCYYLKRIDTTTLNVVMQNRVIENGVTITSDFVPGTTDLVPTPVVLSNSGANVMTAEYITVSALLSLNLTADDCKELLNVATVIYGDENYAIISEIGLCSGADKTVSLVDGGSFKEAIAAQITSFISAFHQIKFTSNGISGLFDIGSNEPLLTVA